MSLEKFIYGIISLYSNQTIEFELYTMRGVFLESFDNHDMSYDSDYDNYQICLLFINDFEKENIVLKLYLEEV